MKARGYHPKTYGDEVAGAYSVMEEEFWADTTPLHRHPEAEEAFLVLDGRLEVWADGVRMQASAGAFIVVPRGTTHALRRLSDGPVRMVTICSPPGLERLFEVVAEQREEELLSDPDRLVALAAEYGTEILGQYPAG